MTVQKNFVVKNGIEVNNNLIFADSGSNKVGIATTNVNYNLHVNGGIGATNFYASGISTVNNLSINGTLSVGNTIGYAGQFLLSTGAGVSWGSPPTVRSVDTRVASVGVSTFTTPYTVGLLDVYVNGIKLSGNEYIANDSITVTLDTPCFGGETVEFITYSPFTIGLGLTSIQGITILEDGVPTGGPLQVKSINFVGASVTAIGSGIAVTVYIDDRVNTNYWENTSSGINTISSVGIGTTNPRFSLEVGSVGASGTSLYVNGDARVTGILTVGSSSIILDGNTNTISVGSEITIEGNTGLILGLSSIDVNGELITGAGVTYITPGTGVYATQNTGNVEIGLDGSFISTQWETVDVGINTISNVGIGTTFPTDKLTVRGGDISVGVNTDYGLVLTSPNGTRYRIIVADNGTLGTVAI